MPLDIAFHRCDALPPVLIDAWARLHAANDAPDAVFGSPRFFAALAETEPGEHLFLATLSCAESGQLIGLSPLRARRRQIDNAGLSRHLLRRRLRVWCLAGSQPMLEAGVDSGPAMTAFMIAMHRAPGRFDALEFPAVASQAVLWQRLRELHWRSTHFWAYLPHGVRTCHQTPLPSSRHLYLQQYSAKKRYNLARQRRQLADVLGAELEVRALDSLATLDALYAAIDRLSPGGGEPAELSRAEYGALYRQGLLLNFLVQAGSQPIALVLGIPSGRTYRVHRILFAQSLARYSPGTTALHVLNEWLIADGRFACLDYGFGEPGRTYSASNTTEERAQVLLLRTTARNRLSLFAHRYVLRLESRARGWLESLRSLVRRLRSGAFAPMLTLCSWYALHGLVQA